MTVQTIGSGLDYEDIADWAAAVKLDSPLSHTWDGEIQDDGAQAWGANSDLDFSAVDLNGNSISLSATTNKHTGDFGTGTYVSGASAFADLYKFNQLTVNDLEFRNTRTDNGCTAGGDGRDCTFNRCLFTSTGNGATAAGFKCQGSGASPFIASACRFEATGATSMGMYVDGTREGTFQACTFEGVTSGFNCTGTLTGVMQNCVSYNATTDFIISTNSLTTETNNASLDNTHPGTSGVDLSSDPFEADGFTPTNAGALDGAGVDLSITLDCGNLSFAATPAIGAYEATATASSTPKGPLGHPFNGPFGGPI